jgi:hypothetical protein
MNRHPRSGLSALDKDEAMIGWGYVKRRLGQYGALWVGGFLAAGAAILIGLLFSDLMVAVDAVLPIVLAGVAIGLGAGVVATFWSNATLGTKLAVLVLAVLLVLPLLWAPVSAAVAVAFFADRPIEYSQAYAGFQIGVAQVLYPLSRMLFGGDMFGRMWALFQWTASIVGFISALSNIWPLIRRVLGPEPATDA